MTQAKDIMTSKRLVTSTPEEKILDVARKMYSEKVGSVFITNNDRLIGVFTERDLVRVVANEKSLNDKVGEHMVRDVIKAKPTDPLSLVASKMIEHSIRHIPVVDKDYKLIGVISIKDILRYIVSSSEFP